MAIENRRHTHYEIPTDINIEMNAIFEKYMTDWRKFPGIIQQDVQDGVLELLVKNDFLKGFYVGVVSILIIVYVIYETKN